MITHDTAQANARPDKKRPKRPNRSDAERMLQRCQPLQELMAGSPGHREAAGPRGDLFIGLLIALRRYTIACEREAGPQYDEADYARQPDIQRPIAPGLPRIAKSMLYTVVQAARRSGFDRNEIRQAIRAKQLPAIRSNYVFGRDLHAWATAQREAQR